MTLTRFLRQGVLDTHRVALNDLNQLRENIRNGKEKKKSKKKKKCVSTLLPRRKLN
jgi:hypothetical protein